MSLSTIIIKYMYKATKFTGKTSLIVSLYIVTTLRRIYIEYISFGFTGLSLLDRGTNGTVVVRGASLALSVSRNLCPSAKGIVSELSSAVGSLSSARVTVGKVVVVS